MREIKFRAWDKETKTIISDEWIQTLDLKCDGSWTIYLGGGMKQYLTQKQSDKKITDCVLLQYTGLKDCAGQEIYEGDILIWESIGVKGTWAVKAVDGGWNPFISDMQTDGAWHYKVIGNIYENPELINKGGSNG